MTEILKGSTCPLEEICKDQLAERFQEFRTRVFWSKPPIERSRIAAEWLKKRMDIHHVSAEQVAMYTRMDLTRLQAILDGSVVMGLSEFSDIYHATLDADESHISPDYLYHHRLYGSLKKITWLQDGWNGEGSKGMPERLVRRFQHHIGFVPDAYLKGWQVSITNDGELKMTRNEITLLLSWEEIHSFDKSQDIRMPFTKENFIAVMEMHNTNKSIKNKQNNENTIHE